MVCIILGDIVASDVNSVYSGRARRLTLPGGGAYHDAIHNVHNIILGGPST